MSDKWSEMHSSNTCSNSHDLGTAVDVWWIEIHGTIFFMYWQEWPFYMRYRPDVKCGTIQIGKTKKWHHIYAGYRARICIEKSKFGNQGHKHSRTSNQRLTLMKFCIRYSNIDGHKVCNRSRTTIVAPRCKSLSWGRILCATQTQRPTKGANIVPSLQSFSKNKTVLCQLISNMQNPYYMAPES